MQSKILNILVVTPGYPSRDNSYYPFVGQLCEEFVRQGKCVSVVCPQSISNALRHRGKLRRTHSVADGNGLVDVYRPFYFTLPYRFKRINNFLFRLTLSLFLFRRKSAFDAYYCHFWQTGYNTYRCINKSNKPLFVATGESDIWKMYEHRKDTASFCNYLKGVIAVSTKNKDDSIKLGLTNAEKCRVLPNAVNPDLFHQRDRSECRKRLKLPQNAFIVIFVGWFIERKGPLRVAQAISKLDGVKSIFIGKGDQIPQCDGILFMGALPHDLLPLYLCSADVFVLPTLYEGCCNAVVEAMACGLPVISSNLSFNWDVLDERNSIMVDPNNVQEISIAIQKLRDGIELRKHLSEGAINKAENLTLNKRAMAILSFMESRI